MVCRSGISNRAIKKINNQDILADIAYNDSHKTARISAISGVENESVLLSIRENDSDKAIIEAVNERLAYFRLKYVANINDEVVLADYAKNDENQQVREEATKRITDQSILEYIAANDNSKYVRWAAVCKLENPDAIARTITMIDYSDIGMSRREMESVLDRITDRTLLKEIALGCISETIRNHCCEKIGGHLPDETNGCKCSNCGAVRHDFKENGRSREEAVGGHTNVFDAFYKCLRCGATKTSRGHRYTDW